MKKILFTAAALLTLSATTGATAQVTVGSTATPQPYSILELESGGSRGLRLPQMTTVQRNALDLAGNPAAQGLRIFNTTTRCVETWNGTSWIASCATTLVPQHFDPDCSADRSCIEIEDYQAVAISSGFNVTVGSETVEMKPVTGGVYYMGFQCNDPSKPNYDNHSMVVDGSTHYQCDLDPEYHTVHQVGLSSFYMSETEVTQGLYKEVMGIETTYPFGWSNLYNKSDSHPAYYVSWYDAIVFCNKLSQRSGRTPVYSVKVDGADVDLVNIFYEDIPYSYPPTSVIPDNVINAWNAVSCDFSANGFRMPTEAEWEYAARGGQANEYTRTLGKCTDCTQYLYSGSNDIDAVAWYGGNNTWVNYLNEPTYGTKQVKGKAPNELGIYDMTGNCWEWCWEWYGTYDDCCTLNPHNPESIDGGNRAVRGGSFDPVAGECRLTRRHNVEPYYRNYVGIAIRLVSSATN